MHLTDVLARLLASPHATRGEAWDPVEPPLEPHFGDLEWTPPPSYRALAASGLRRARREVMATGSMAGFALLVGDERTAANADLVHLPDGVSRDPGVYLSTNHLVGFAEAGQPRLGLSISRAASLPSNSRSTSPAGLALANHSAMVFGVSSGVPLVS